MPWVSRTARIHQRWLTRTDASPSRHREVLPGKSNASDTHAKNAKRASYDDGGVGEAAQPAVSWKQAVKRRKRQKPTKKLSGQARAPGEGPPALPPQKHTPLVIDLRTPSPPPTLMCSTDLRDTPISSATSHSTNRGLSRVPTWVTSPASVSRQPSPAQDLIDELDSDSEVENESIPPLEAREYHVQEKPVAAIRSGIAESPFDRLGGICRRRPISLSPDPPVEPQQGSSASQGTSRQVRRQSFPLSDDSDDGVIVNVSQPAHIVSRGLYCPPAFEPFLRFAFDTPPPDGFVSAKTTIEGGASDARVDRDDIDHGSASTLAMTAVEDVHPRPDCRVDVNEIDMDNQDGRKDILISPDLDHAEKSESVGEQRSVSPGSNRDDLEGANNIPQVDCETNYVGSGPRAGSLAGPFTPASRSFHTASELGTPLSASIVEHILGDFKAHNHPHSPARAGHLHSDVILETASSIFLAIGRALDVLVRARSACQCDQSGGRRSSQEILSNSLELPETAPTTKQHPERIT
ncbi:hypothetical protein JCM24511_03603 [Saitozyma sp. JCM 24511]|nr:hypothetical protein JCM24511_03603 [Saitozyma sp. JCM 24511]